MADLSIIGYVIHWISLIILCKKRLSLLLIFTFGIYISCFLYLMSNDNYENIDSHNWSWFGYVKHIGLVIGYLAYVFVYTTNSKASAIFAQWQLTINVFEAGLLGLQSFEIVPGLLLFLISPFSPQFFVNQNNKTLIGKDGNILQKQNFNLLSVKWYMRCHLIIFTSFYFGGAFWNDYKLNGWILLTSLIPLAMNEYYLDNFLNHFSIRAFSLFTGSIIYIALDDKWMNKQPTPILHHDLNIIWRNIIELIIILFLFGLVILNDKYRASNQEKADDQQDENIEFNHV